MLHKETVVQEVMQKMRELLFDFAILGGYPRDLANGRSPKDLDICVFNFHVGDIAEQRFYEMLRIWLEDRNLIRNAFDEHHPSAQDDSRVLGVLALTCDVDIIFWNAENKWGVINNFDFNINQYELAVNGDSFTPIYHGNNHGVLRYVRPHDQLSQERVDKIADIAHSMEWDTCQIRTTLTT